tara:strand:+ start:7821 stop:8414 length:594 start_codon:yes stop_codon:yes gene_type:complete
MAYPEVNGPYGLRPINLIGGQPFAGSTRQRPIASASATAIFYGDVVQLNSAGTLEKSTGTDAATPVGVFMGCSYTDSTYGLTFRQSYPGAITASDISATVLDDPDALFKVVVTSSGTTVGGVAQTVIGNNAVLVQNTGDTPTGNSRVAIDDTTATTSTWPVRIIDGIDETKNSSGSYTEVIVKWNAGMHQYNNPTGV